MATSNVVPKLYRGVIEDVIKNVRESFLNEGVDEQVLQELKQIWESKLLQSRAVDGMPAEGQVQATRQQYVYPHVAPHASIASQVQPVPREAHRVSIAPASVRVPDAVTPQQAASGQTAILYPSTHGHALGQMTAAASAATMAIPGHLSQLQSQLQQGTATHTYPTARTIQTTQQVGNLQQRIVNTTQPRHVIGTTQQQVIRTTQHQPTIVGNTQVTQVIRGAQPQVIRGAQPQVICGAQPQVIRGIQPQVIRGAQPQVIHIRGPQPQVIRGAQPQVQVIRGAQPQVIRGAQPQVQVIRGAQPQVIRGAQPQVIRGAQPQVQVIRGAQPQVIRGAQPQVIRGAQPQVIRGAQPQVIRGTQPGTIRVTQPHVIQMTQLQAGEKPVSVTYRLQCASGTRT
ncbi:Transcription initiation factor IIA subunit 1 [Desmophyllum pertusum]|uniref:Transcription initiation factor IIA subunit 1 n=1 Tax=Desmophyllum pertusum TaxID=174260 RepID=A0A9W9ZH16_9CNID|nr:Transcription initiation factor IIA subunit 1 [Desmophyllum pertusum]